MIVILGICFRAGLSWVVVVHPAASAIAHTSVSRWIRAVERVVPDVAVKVPALRVFGLLVCKRFVGGQEATEVGAVIAGSEVVEAGFGVAFFAGEFVRHLVVVVTALFCQWTRHMSHIRVPTFSAVDVYHHFDPFIAAGTESTTERHMPMRRGKRSPGLCLSHPMATNMVIQK